MTNRVKWIRMASAVVVMGCASATGPSGPVWCKEVGAGVDAKTGLTVSVWVSPIPGINCVVPK